MCGGSHFERPPAWRVCQRELPPSRAHRRAACTASPPAYPSPPRPGSRAARSSASGARARPSAPSPGFPPAATPLAPRLTVRARAQAQTHSRTLPSRSAAQRRRAGRFSQQLLGNNHRTTLAIAVCRSSQQLLHNSWGITSGHRGKFELTDYYLAFTERGTHAEAARCPEQSWRRPVPWPSSAGHRSPRLPRHRGPRH